MMDDKQYMARALELARKGAGKVSPNPMVGSVLVKDGKIISEGWHKKYGDLHAERNCILNCHQDMKGAVLYVTLEPCCHYGKTPPCTDIIIESGIKKVVVGASDPNPLVMGKGVKILESHGIQVVTGVLEKECLELNRAFFHYITTGRPFVTLKYAMTMDGKIATVSGKSRWITGEKARENVHHDRNFFAGIMTGIGTVLKDDPLLTCRIPGGRNPVRIICDSGLKLPLESAIVKSANEGRVIIATCCRDASRYAPYVQAGCQVVFVKPDDGGHVHLPSLMDILGQEKIDGILLECGGTLAWAALQSGIVSRVQTYIAPKIFGGDTALGAVGGQGVEAPDQAFCLKPVKYQWLGEDLFIESEVKNHVYRDC